METRDLHYFITLAETRNYSQTAKKYGITTPAISAMLRRLESELNVSLIYKENNRSILQLTPAGLALYRQAHKILRLEKTSQQMVQRAGQKNFRLGFSGLASYTWLPAFLDIFAKNHILKNVVPHQESSLNLVKHLKAGYYDAIIYSELTAFPFERLDSQILKYYDLKIFANKVNPLAHQDQLSFTDITNQTIITYHQNYLGRRVFDLALRKAHVQLNKAQILQVDNPAAIIQLIARNTGISYLADTSFPIPTAVKAIPLIPQQREKVTLKFAVRPEIVPNAIQEQCLKAIDKFLNNK